MNEQTTIPTLHHLTSSISFNVLVALEEVNALRPNGLKYEIKIYPRQNSPAPDSLKEVFLLGKSPILVVKPIQGGEEKVLTEHRYIIQWISEKYADNKLTPSSAVDKEREAFMREFVKGSLQGKIDLTFPFDVIPKMLPWGLRHMMQAMFSPILSHFHQDLKDIYQYLEDNLSDNQPWLSGEHLGIADLLAIFHMTAAIQRNFGWDASKYPRLAMWYDAIVSRPAYQAALKKGGMFNIATFM